MNAIRAMTGTRDHNGVVEVMLVVLERLSVCDEATVVLNILKIITGTDKTHDQGSIASRSGSSYRM